MTRIALVVLVCMANPASADPPTSPITDSNYSIELYDGTAIGNTAVVGMGGATVALAIGTSGTLFNPSAPAVKPTTDTDWWSWDYHIDYLNGSLSTDYDNNGFIKENGTSVFTGGFGLRFGDWAGAFTLTYQTAPVAATVMLPQGERDLAASTARAQLAIARWVPQLDTAIGVSIQAGSFSFAPDCTEAGCDELFGIGPSLGVEAGATWAPREQNFRLGAAFTSPIARGEVAGCDPGDCVGWTLPEQIVTPARLALGGAYRFSPSVWNQLVGGYFRDEKSVTIATDLVIIGPSANAFGLEAFGDHVLQRVGRHTALSVRSGVEYEWVPGRFRIRGGTYWEPGRFVDVSGRLHFTLGLELRVFQFKFWGRQRRGRISLTSDVARNYGNGGLSVGFWH